VDFVVISLREVTASVYRGNMESGPAVRGYRSGSLWKQAFGEPGASLTRLAELRLAQAATA